MILFLKKALRLHWLLLLTCFCLFSPSSKAEEPLLIVGGQVDLTSGLGHWINQETVDKGPSYNECRTATNNSPVLLCVHGSLKTMHSFIGRASAFIEGVGSSTNPSGKNIPKGVLLARGNRALQGYEKSIAGFDLKGSDLRNYYNTVNSQCRSGKKKMCFSSDEKDFFETDLLPQIKKNPNFVLLTGTTEDGLASAKHIIEHEVMHARYFTDENFRKIIDEYWAKNLSSEDRRIVIDNLRADYDVSDEFLVRNEFQAYLLVGGQEFTRLSSRFLAHRERLIRLLQRKGLAPGFIDEHQHDKHKSGGTSA